jgi:phosphoribosylformylglycinamidine (FGAM) synthase-like amidotransferase family enzyme
MSNTLQGKKIAILAADGVEKVELEQPRSVLSENGAQVQVLSLKTDDIQARNHNLEPAGTFRIDQLVSRVSVDQFDALVLPGGTVNPDKLRLDDTAVSFVREFVNSGFETVDCGHLTPQAVITMAIRISKGRSDHRLSSIEQFARYRRCLSPAT